ncbi:MAG: hypothetical protein P4L33_18225 [Capsulimonadaceae bacterium]|nr:hypothetical protein [Capsulimonadaceae bacterium]
MQDQKSLRIPRGYGVGWVGEAWNIFRLSPWLWIFAGIGTYVVQLIVSEVAQLAYDGPVEVLKDIAGGHMPSSMPTFAWWQYLLMAGGSLASLVVHAYLLAGQMRMGLLAMRRQPVRVEDAFSAWSRALPMFCYGLLLSALMLVCFIPIGIGIYNARAMTDPTAIYEAIGIGGFMLLVWLFLYTLALPGQVLVADGVGVWTAFKKSFRASIAHFSALIGAFTVTTLLWIGAICTAFLGWFVLYPMWWILLALMARDIAGLTANIDEPPTLDLSSYSHEQAPGIWPPPPAEAPGELTDDGASDSDDPTQQ